MVAKVDIFPIDLHLTFKALPNGKKCFLTVKKWIERVSKKTSIIVSADLADMSSTLLLGSSSSSSTKNPSLDEEATDSVELQLSELFPEEVDALARFAGLWVASAKSYIWYGAHQLHACD